MSLRPGDESPDPRHAGLIGRLQRRGVFRVAISYAVIAWLLLQISDVVMEPLGAPSWAMRTLIILLIAGFPIALALAWYFELGPGGITIDHLPEHASRPRTGGLRRYSDAIIIAILLAIIVLLLARQEGWLAPKARSPVVAVLPFSEIGSNRQTYYGDGLADTLIHRLGQLSGLVVLASNSTFEFRGSGNDLKELARKLDADLVLEGSLQSAGGVLRLNTRLVDAATGQQRWVASFNRKSDDLFEVQDEIANAVTSALQLVLTPQESERLIKRDTLNLSAFDAYQRALEGLSRRNPEGMASALQYLFDAIQTDPNFALAHAKLAEAYFLASSYRPLDTPWSSVAEQAKDAADIALALDPGLGDAYLAKALVALGDNAHSGADPVWPNNEITALLKKAVELNPSNAMAWKYYANMGDTQDERMARLQKAAQLDPRSGIIRMNIGDMYGSLGDPVRARQWYLLAIGTSQPYFQLALMGMTSSYWNEPGGLAMAARWSGAFARAYPDDQDARREFCRALIELGALDEALREAQKLNVNAEDSSDYGYIYRLAHSARIYRAKGDLETAATYAKRFTELLLPSVAADRGELGGPPLTVIDVAALGYVSAGEPRLALELYETMLPHIEKQEWGVGEGDGLNARMLKSAIRKQVGDRKTAETELRAYLGEIESRQSVEMPFHPFVPFALHAFLGNTEAAISALRNAVDAGNYRGWWGLRDGTFDGEYAATWDDPRCQELMREIERRVTVQREAYFADPNLPMEAQLQAGLDTRLGKRQ